MTKENVSEIVNLITEANSRFGLSNPKFKPYQFEVENLDDVYCIHIYYELMYSSVLDALIDIVKRNDFFICSGHLLNSSYFTIE